MDNEMKEFCSDLVESIKQMKVGMTVRTSKVIVSDITRARNTSTCRFCFR